MNISWLGHACVRISDKIENDEVVVVTSPFGKELGLFPPKIKADIVVANRLDDDYHYFEKVQGNIDEKFLVIDRPGEYESRQVFVTGVDHVGVSKSGTTRSVIYKIIMNHTSVVHMGGVVGELTEEEVDQIGDVDILLIPVGGGDRLDAAKAAEIVRQLEPRIVIPIEYMISGVAEKMETEQKFIKEVGLKPEKMPKLKISRKEMPEDKTVVYILEKE